MRGSFGSVRNLNHETKVLASGDNLRSQIEAKADEVESLKANYEKLRADQIKFRNTKKEGGYCANNYPAWGNKREICQQQIDSQYEVMKSATSTALTKLKNAQNQLESLRSQLETQIQSELNLSEQGLTAEAVNQMAQAEANATVQKAQQEAQSKMASKRVRNIILISVGLAVVVLGSLYFYYKIRSNKK